MTLLMKQSHITQTSRTDDAAAIITMTTNTAANTLETHHLTTTDVEEGDGLILHQNLPRDPAVDVWNRGFCFWSCWRRVNSLEQESSMIRSQMETRSRYYQCFGY